MPPICTPDGGARVTNHGEWNGGLPRRNNTRNLVLGGIGLFMVATLVGTAVGWLNASRAELSNDPILYNCAAEH